MRLFFISVFFLAFQASFCQDDLVFRQLIPLGQRSEFIVVDNDTITVLSSYQASSINKKLIFHNQQPLDSARNTIYNLRFMQGMIFGSDTYFKLIAFKNFGNVFEEEIGQSEGRSYVSDFDSYYIRGNLQLWGVGNEHDKILVDMTSTFCANKPCVEFEHETIENVTKLDSSQYFIEGCLSSDIGPSCATKHYYLVDKVTKAVTNVTDRLAFAAHPTCKRKIDVEVVAKTRTEDVFKININKLDAICRFEIKQSYLVDRDMNVLSQVLPFGIDIDDLVSNDVGGLVYKNSRLFLRYYYSTLDDKARVLVPYDFNPQLDICMYKAFNQTRLTITDVKRLLDYERKILEQLVYARHNAKFSDNFYEGYFNLFTFYNDKKRFANRTKIEEVVLTPVDQANLALIKSVR